MGIDWLALTSEPQGAAEVARLVRTSPPLSGPLPGSLRTDEPQKIRWGSAPNGKPQAALVQLRSKDRSGFAVAW
jgi:hypothetical protein